MVDIDKVIENARAAIDIVETSKSEAAYREAAEIAPNLNQRLKKAYRQERRANCDHPSAQSVNGPPWTFCNDCGDVHDRCVRCSAAICGCDATPDVGGEA